MCLYQINIDDIKALAHYGHLLVRRSADSLAFACKKHLMSLPPVGKRSVAFALCRSKLSSDFFERHHFYGPGLNDAKRSAGEVGDDAEIAGFRYRRTLDLVCPKERSRRPLYTLNNECPQLIGHLLAVTEVERLKEAWRPIPSLRLCKFAPIALMLLRNVYGGASR